MNEWIKWNGGECPVPNNTRTRVKFRNGIESQDSDPQGWSWGHDYPDMETEYEIVAYKVVESDAQ